MFYNAWKHQKTCGFPLFSGDIERENWPKVGYRYAEIGYFIQPNAGVVLVPLLLTLNIFHTLF